MLKINKLFALIFFLLSSFGFQNSLAKAQDYQATPCDESQYSALAQLPGGSLDVYLRAGRKEDANKARVYYRAFDGTDCTEIGQVNAKTKDYQLVGSLLLPEGTNLGTVHVKVDTTTDNYAGASVPQVVLVDSSSKPCNLVEGCNVSFNDQPFTLSPKKVSLSEDSLRVGVLLPLVEEIKEVLYSVDGKPAYTKTALEEFNLNYVPDGEHTVSRTVVLKNGQSLTDSKVVKRGLEGGATYLFISILYGQSTLLRYVGVVLVFILIYTLITAIIKHVNAKRRWKREHFFDPSEHFDTSKAGARIGLSGEESYSDIFRHYKGYFAGGLVMIVGFFVITTYVFTIFTVDGVSMYPTLQDQSKKALLTLPVNIGKLNDNYYLPARGEIVVVQKDENNLFDSLDSSEAQKQYVVKRVVGLPGDRVVIRDGKLTIFNKENPKGYEPDVEFGWISDLSGSESIAMNVELSDAEIFIVGDNRDESIDSRYYGPVSTSLVVGRVL